MPVEEFPILQSAESSSDVDPNNYPPELHIEESCEESTHVGR